MKVKYFFTKLLLFSLPFIFFIGLYIYYDPFKVVWNYPKYFVSDQPNYISMNKDHISTQNWINHYPKYQYNSYILGNSRSMYYQIDHWKNYINEPYARCYHFDAAGESIYGVAKKLDFLYNRKASIENCLIITDNEELNQAKNSAGHLFLKDPFISGESRFSFQVESIKAFFDFKFLTSFLDFKFSGKVKDYMKKDFLLDDRPFYYDYVTNELQQKYFEKVIQNDPAQYYASKSSLFFVRDSLREDTATAVIKANQKELLLGMKRIFDEKKTNYKFVISPLYNQLRINPKDLAIMREIFGAENVFDFSGINSFTRDVHNYYETSHYRPKVADEVMRIVYSGQSPAVGK